MPSTAFVDGKLVFTYQADSNAVGATLTPEVSADLLTWGAAPQAVAGTKVGSITTYTVTLPTTDPRKFFRLRNKYK
jgi:hypothetical protein